LIVTVLRKTKVSRAECARLGQDVKQLAEDIKALLASEQRRFLKEINAAKKDDDQTPWQREMARPQQATPTRMKLTRFPRLLKPPSALHLAGGHFHDRRPDRV
jgi:hypothetical protein